MELSDLEKYVQKQLEEQAVRKGAEDADGTRRQLPKYLLAGLTGTERFGPFELRSQLGIGGFGVVFLSQDTRTGRTLALKLPLPQVLLSSKARKMFERDGSTGHKLDHPGIVKVHDFGEVDGIPYIASEYVEGPTLERWLKKRGDGISTDDAVELVRRIADALDHAHSKGVVHRDLKPANILLGRGSGDDASIAGPQPLITDFGLAQVRDELRTDLTASTSAAIIGSIPYMAPEQITGPKGSVGPGTDVYALGVIFYHMLTGTMPFPGVSGEAIIRKIVHEPVEPVRSRRPSVPVELATICERCLRKKPHRRFTSAAELRDDLERYQRGQRIFSRPMPRWEKAFDWSRRNPAATVAMLAAAAFMGQQAYQVRELRRFNAELTVARDLAERKEREADDNLRLANERNRLVQRYYYDRRLLDAQAAMADRNDLLAQRILAGIDPGEADREFVWNYLWRKSREKVEYRPIAGGDEGFSWLADPGAGPWLAVATESRKIQILDTRTWQVAGVLENADHGHESLKARLSPDGNRIYLSWILHSDKPGREEPRFLRLAVWDIGLRRFVSVVRFEIVANYMPPVTFRAGSDLCFTEVLEESKVANALKFALHSYDFRTGELSRPALPEGLSIMRFSPDGHLVAGWQPPHELKVWNTADFSREAFRLRLPEGAVPNDITFFENGTKIAAVDREGSRVITWKLEANAAEPAQPEAVHPVSNASLQLIWPAEEHGGLIAMDRMNRLGRLDLAVNRLDHFTFDPADPGANQEYGTGWHHGSDMMQSGGWLFMYTIQPNIGNRSIVWDIATKRQIVLPPRWLTNFHTWKSPESGRLWAKSDQALFEWWPKRQFKMPEALDGHADEAWCAAFTPDGARIVTGSDDKDAAPTLKAWDRWTGKALWGVKAHGATVAALAMHPAGTVVATGSLDKDSANVRLWDMATGHMTAELKGLDLGVKALKFSPDGKRLAAGDKTGRCVVWDVASGKVVRDIQAGTRQVQSLRFPGDGRSLITTTQDGWIKFWDLETGQSTRQFFTSNGSVGLTISPDGKTVVGASDDGRIFVRNFETGEILRQFEMPSHSPWAKMLFPDGKTLAAGDKAGNLMMWDLETGTEKFRTKAHDAQINALTLSPDGKTLISCAHDGTVRLWHAGPEF